MESQARKKQEGGTIDSIVQQIRHYIILYRAGEYTEDTLVRKIISIPGICIEQKEGGINASKNIS